MIAAVSLTTVACKNIPYRIDVDQGNIVDAKTLSRLQPGMTKVEVQRILGSSLLTDIFHSNRWDYVQYFQSGKDKTVQEGKVSLFFTNGLLTQLKAEELVEIKSEDVPYSILKQ